jgi:TfoX/Sxy family transcriptional regulator of competence genes
MAEFDPTTLKDRLESLRGELPYEISTRPMMGGFIGYADGRVFVSMSRGGGFGVKLLPADQELLLGRPGSRRMQHAPNQPESKTYIALSAGDLEDDDVLLAWLRRSAETAPGKTRRR